MKIFGLGMPELLIILGVALLIFGPKHLPKLGSALGKTIKNLRDGFNSGDGVIKKTETDEDETEAAAPKRRKKAPKQIEAAETAPESVKAEDSATA